MASHEAGLGVDKTKEIRDEKENVYEALDQVRRWRQHMKHITEAFVSRCGMRRKYEQQH